MSRETPVRSLPTDPSTLNLVNDILAEINENGGVQSSSAAQQQMNDGIFENHVLSRSENVLPLAPKNSAEKKMLEDQVLSAASSFLDDEDVTLDSSGAKVVGDSVSSSKMSVSETVDKGMFEMVTDAFSLENVVGFLKSVILFALINYLIATFLTSAVEQVLVSVEYTRIFVGFVGGILYACISLLL